MQHNSQLSFHQPSAQRNGLQIIIRLRVVRLRESMKYNLNRYIIDALDMSHKLIL